MSEKTELELNEVPGQTSLLEEESPKEEAGRRLPQFLAGGCANIIGIMLGTILSWSSPSIRHLQDEDSPIPITTEENSWISSLMPLAAVFGPIAGGYVAQNFGRKRALMVMTVPIIIHFICLAVADAVWVLYLGRVLGGFALGWGFTVLPMYCSEVAEKEYRGALGSLIQLGCSIGILFDYAVGPFVPFMWLSISSLVFPCLFLPLFFFVPETPYFLLMKGQEDEARKALQWLRGKSAAGVATELKIMKTEVDEAAQLSGGMADIWNVVPNRKAVGLCIGLLAFQQFSGINVVLFNAESIFANAGGSLTPSVSAIIVGVVMVLSAFPTPILVEKLGRRILFLASAIGMCISLVVLGVCFYLDETGTDTSSFSALPIVSVLAFLIFYSPGFGPLPWAVMAEMYPANIKAFGSTLSASTTWFISFLVTRFFNDLVESIGNSYTFWLFAACCAVGSVFVYFLLPETKGKTIAEIQKELS